MTKTSSSLSSSSSSFFLLVFLQALYETPVQFAARMSKVEHHLNYDMGDGESLLNLGKDLHQRCDDLKKLKGERLPK